MVKVQRTFVVDRPAEVVAEYLADFSNAVDWDPGTVACVRLDSGPVQEGARWRNTSRVLGRETELDYELAVKSRSQVKLVGRNKTATSVDDIRLRPHGTRTEVTYVADIQFHGWAKLSSPLMRLVFERLGNKVEKQLPTAVAALP